jgi:signal transduction histidine kinase
MSANFEQVLKLGGRAGARLAAMDGAVHPLGPLDAWPRSLRAALGLCLSSPVPSVIAWGPEQFVFANDAFASMLGTQALGARAAELCPETSQALRRVLESLSAGEAPAEVGPLFSGVAHGVRGQPSHGPIAGDDGAVAGVLTTFADASDDPPRTLASSDDRYMRDYLRALFQEAPVAVSLVRGPEFVFELANPLYEQMVGRARLIGRAFREVFRELPEDAPVLRMLRNVRATGTPFTASEYLVPVDRKGSGGLDDTFFLFTCQPFHGPHGLDDAILTVAVDVTAQVRMRRENEALSLERESLLAKEQRARSEAESANGAKDEFLAMLGHELRNPLAPISTALHLLRQHEPRFRKEHVVIERQVAHLTQLVDDLLDVSRITRGKLELRRSLVETSSVVAKAIEVASPILEGRQHHLEVDVPKTGLPLLGDSARLAQVLANLLVNAAKYTDPGGHIAVVASADLGEVVIRVRDDGIGIDPAVLPRIFESFVQARQALDRSQGGLGLGLTIVKSLVALHNGTVSAESDGKGKGSEFAVRLPMAPELEPESRASNRPAPSSSAARQRVLIVDDNIDAADLLADWFGAKGEETRVAYDGPEALAIARDFRPQVALIDIGLPAMDGYEVARRLRADRELRTMCLVAVTGYGQRSDRERSAASGFDAHLVKPLDLLGLESLLRKLQGTA